MSISVLKSSLSRSDCCSEVSFDPTWTTTVAAEGYSDSTDGILEFMSRTRAPGKQRVSALGRVTCLTIDEPTRSTDGGAEFEEGWRRGLSRVICLSRGGCCLTCERCIIMCDFLDLISC